MGAATAKNWGVRDAPSGSTGWLEGLVCRSRWLAEALAVGGWLNTKQLEVYAGSAERLARDVARHAPEETEMVETARNEARHVRAELAAVRAASRRRRKGAKP